MRSIQLIINTVLLAVVLTGMHASAETDEALNLDEASDSYNYFGRYGQYPKLTGYGTGGYGDPTQPNFNLNVCASGQASGDQCTEFNPETGHTEWRFVRNLGWRKFTTYGAARKDWWEYKQTQRWPFNRYQTFGWNW